MTNDLQQNDENAITLINENQLNQFKAFYYLIKGKRDTDIKLFTDFKQFTFSDLIELNAKIYNKLILHQLVTDIVNVTIGLSNKEIKSFGSWKEFEDTDWDISASTKYVSIVWDFNLILPNQAHTIPQTHTLRVRIGNNLKPSEMVQIVFQGGEEYDLEEAQSQMSCKIDFINAQICTELKNIVTEWYDALPKNGEEHKLIRFILKHEVKFQHFIVLCFITASVILMNFIFSAFFNKQSNYLPEGHEHKFYLFLSISIIILYFFYQLGRLFAARMMRKQIGKLRRNPMFQITKGDTNRFAEVKKENKRYLKGLGASLVVGVLINGVSVLIGYVIQIIVR